MNKIEIVLLLLFPVGVFFLSLYYYPIEPSESEPLASNETELLEAPKYVKSVLVVSRLEEPVVMHGRVVEVKSLRKGNILTLEDGKRVIVFLPQNIVREPEQLVGNNVTLYGPIVKTKKGEAVLARALIVDDERPEPQCFAKERMKKKCDDLKEMRRRPTYR